MTLNLFCIKRCISISNLWIKSFEWVIVIATKKGGKITSSVHCKTSYNTVDKLIDVYGADEFREMVKALNDPSANLHYWELQIQTGKKKFSIILFP